MTIENSLPQNNKPQPEKPDYDSFSDQEIRQTLTKEYGLVFEDPDFQTKEYAESIDQNALVDKLTKIGIDKQIAEMIITQIINYLKLPIITDPKFNEKTYNDRKEEISKKYGDKFKQLYKENKLREDHLSDLYGIFRVIKQDLQENNDSLAQKVCEKTKSFPANELYSMESYKHYAKLSTEKKKEYLKKVDEFLIEFLDILKK